MHIRNGSFSYGDNKILNNINFWTDDPEIIMVLGDNGCGKSTFLKCLSHELVWKEGEINIPHPCEMIFMGDNVQLYEHLTGFEYLQFIQTILGQSNKNLIERLMKEYDLIDKKDVLILHYSRGMKQKLFLCSILLDSKVKYILLDEPFTGVDKKSLEVIKKNLKNLKNNNVTIIFTTHQINEFTSLCDKKFFVQDSRMIRC